MSLQPCCHALPGSAMLTQQAELAAGTQASTISPSRSQSGGSPGRDSSSEYERAQTPVSEAVLALLCAVQPYCCSSAVSAVRLSVLLCTPACRSVRSLGQHTLVSFMDRSSLTDCLRRCMAGRLTSCCLEKSV